MEIIQCMLGTIQDKGGSIKPTHLMYKANLSHKKLMEYVNELLAKNLLAEVEEGDHKFYTITEEGHNFLSEYRHLKKFVDSFGF